MCEYEYSCSMYGEYTLMHYSKNGVCIYSGEPNSMYVCQLAY